MISKVVIASDSFKGSLTSLQVAEAAGRGVRDVCPDTEVVCVNVADGGEGTVEAVVSALGGEQVDVMVNDSLGRPVKAEYGLLDGGKAAVIEMAQASGLTLLSEDERNPLRTSTYGTGEMIADALRRGCRKIFMGIGGSATNDGGMGMLAALGYRFYGAEGELLDPCGEAIEKVMMVNSENVPSELKEVEFVVACDVDNPFYGPKGAACVFAPQKGADSVMVEELDWGLRHFAAVIHDFTGIDVSCIPGAGAAGGLGGALKAFLGAEMIPGIEMVLDAIKFDEIIENADLVITGEGRIDFQTASGKTPAGVLKRAKKHGIPVIAIGGSVHMCPEVETLGFAVIESITTEGTPLEIAMNPSVAMENIRNTVRKILIQP